MERAEQIALAQIPAERQITVVHLLLALCQSAHAHVRHVLDSVQLTPERLMAALPQVQRQTLKRNLLYTVRETLEVVVTVLLMVILIKQGLGEFRLIPSESMLPTLQVGDRIVVEKVSMWAGHKPERGDILVFYPPEPETILRQDPWSVFLRLTGLSGLIYNKESRIDTAFIKRVVGLPGDIVDVRPADGVYVNGTRLEEPYVNEVAYTCTFVTACGPVRVPAHMYYMMGDNRNHSADSRYWQFLPEDRIIGQAVFRFFPLDRRLGSLNTAARHTP
jgi:signal peptidase I